MGGGSGSGIVRLVQGARTLRGANGQEGRTNALPWTWTRVVSPHARFRGQAESGELGTYSRKHEVATTCVVASHLPFRPRADKRIRSMIKVAAGGVMTAVSWPSVGKHYSVG